jgi:hypothetical protein
MITFEAALHEDKQNHFLELYVGENNTISI